MVGLNKGFLKFDTVLMTTLTLGSLVIFYLRDSLSVGDVLYVLTVSGGWYLTGCQTGLIYGPCWHSKSSTSCDEIKRLHEQLLAEAATRSEKHGFKEEPQERTPYELGRDRRQAVSTTGGVVEKQG